MTEKLENKQVSHTVQSTFAEGDEFKIAANEELEEDDE